MTVVTLRSQTPVIRTTRPTIPNAAYKWFTESEFYTYLQSQGDRYRSTPIYIDGASLVAHRYNEPIIAGRTLCAAPATDGGYASPSPNALIRDRYHNLEVVAAEDQDFTGSLGDTATIAIEPLTLDLPLGFVIAFSISNTLYYLQVAVAASAGATSLTLSKIWQDVSVTTGDVAYARNGYFYQRGTPSVNVSDLLLYGDPYQYIGSVSYEKGLGRYYACDGVAVAGAGAQFHNLQIFNFPGHGLWSDSNLAEATLTGMITGLDRLDIYADNISVVNCLAGITLRATDSHFTDLVVAGCRDYGVRILGSTVQGGNIHAYGCGGKQVWITGDVRANNLQGETGDYGVELDNVSGENTSTKSQINGIFAHDNAYAGARILGTHIYVGSVIVTHTSTQTNSADTAHLTGYGVLIGSYSDNFACPHLYIKGGTGSKALCIGEDLAFRTLENIRIAGRIEGSSSALGVDCGSLVGSDLDLAIGGHTTDFKIRPGATFAGNTVRLRGATSGTIIWPDATTGTFGTPNVPSAISSTNTVTTHTY